MDYEFDYCTEIYDQTINRSKTNKIVCKQCVHKDVCYMYKDICEGRKWYQDYFGINVLCPYYKKEACV